MRRNLSLLLVLTIVFTNLLGIANPSFAYNNEPNILAQYAVLMDYETGKVLYNKNGNQKLYPASTTKAWTAYLVIKHVDDLNEVITIKDLPHITGSSMYLRNGESFTVKELLDALLVHSCNDVAYVLAKHVSGSIDKFAELMNSEAKKVGAQNTHFNNPHGLPDDNHYTTAYDMALMSRKAMSNPTFSSIVKMKYVKYPPTEAYPFERHFKNTNKFLTSNEKINYKGKQTDIRYDIVDGLKTGFTDKAGKCLLSSATKNDMRVIAAVFKSNGNDLYTDSRNLLDYGFDNFYSSTVVKKESYRDEKNVLFTKQKTLIYQPKHSYSVVLPNGTSQSEYTTKVKLDKIKLPIKTGDKVGTLKVYADNKLESSIDLIAQNNLNSSFSFITENVLLINLIKLILIIGLVFVLLVVYVFIKKARRRKSISKNVIDINRKKIKRNKRR